MRKTTFWAVFFVLLCPFSVWARSEEAVEAVWQPDWTSKLIRSGVIFLIGIVLFKLLRVAISRLSEKFSEKNALRESENTLQLKTLLQLVNWGGTILIIGLVAYMFLDTFGINMAPMLAGAGIAGLAFGFGGQYLIRDLINGVFILVENQYRINDVVQIGNHGGLVESVNLRHTRLRDLEGRVIYIPNGEVTSVINFTKEYAQALLDIGVAYKENADQVMEVIKQIAQGMREDDYFGKLILGDLEMLGVDAFLDFQFIVKCRMKTLPIKQWEVAREFRRRIKNRFDELDIRISFPHRTLYLGHAKDNDFLREALAKK